MARNQAADGQPVPMDYEHQLIWSRSNGMPAPMSGETGSLENRGPEGLWGVGVEWKQRAQDYLKAREYRYLSGVYVADHTDPVTGKNRGMWLHSIALVNLPFIPGLARLSAAGV